MVERDAMIDVTKNCFKVLIFHSRGTPLSLEFILGFHRPGPSR